MEHIQQVVEGSKTPTTGSGQTPHPRRFDRATYNQISGLDARLLELIDYDCRIRAKISRTGARYSIKPEAYFARILSVTRETISHRVCHLEDLGILDVTRRSPVRGIWQTNMYKIVSFVWWRLRKVLRGLRKRPYRVNQPSHLSIPKREKKPEKTEGGEPTAIKSTLMSLFQQIKAGQSLKEL